MSTVRQLLEASLRLAGVVGQGQTPAAYLYASALSALNIMLDQWSSGSQGIYYTTRDSLTMTSGQASRTIGTGGNFNVARPVRIFDSLVTDGVDHPVTVKDRGTYDRISDKTNPGRPVIMHYEPTFPLGTLYFYPVPDAAFSFTLISLKPLPTYALADTVSLPPGYERAIKYNLALEIGPEYGVPPKQDVVAIAGASLSMIHARNLVSQMGTMDLNPIGDGRVDSYPGELFG